MQTDLDVKFYLNTVSLYTYQEFRQHRLSTFLTHLLPVCLQVRQPFTHRKLNVRPYSRLDSFKRNANITKNGTAISNGLDRKSCLPWNPPNGSENIHKIKTQNSKTNRFLFVEQNYYSLFWFNYMFRSFSTIIGLSIQYGKVRLKTDGNVVVFDGP